MNTQYAVALVTAPNLKTARSLAQAALTARLAACVNLLPAIESHYWWKNHLETSREILLIAKTTRNRVPALQRLILEQHPYDTPEFIVLSITRGASRYLDWIAASVASATPKVAQS